MSYLAGSYQFSLVLLSVFVAMMASYTALSLAGRVTETQGRASTLWLVGGAVAMGCGIWSMHFIGMLAFSLPIRLSYDLLWTLVSLLAAIGVSAFALRIVTRPTIRRFDILLGGILMGAGIVCMHYMGMQALKMNPGIDYDPAIVAFFRRHCRGGFHRRLVAGIHPAFRIWLARPGQEGRRGRHHGPGRHRHALHGHGSGAVWPGQHLHGQGWRQR